MSTPNPVSFREVQYDLMGTKVTIAGLAHPIRYNTAYQPVLAFLKGKGYKALISLDEDGANYRRFGIPDFETIRNDWKKDDASASHVYFHLPDYDAPSIAMYEELFACIRDSVMRNLPIAIHCGAGHGRTGTMLAAIAIYESLDQQYAADPLEFQAYNPVNDSTAIRTPCSSNVSKAIAKVRSVPNGGGSVENVGQVQSLNELEKVLVEKFKKEKPVPVLPATQEKIAPAKLPVQFREIEIKLDGGTVKVAGMAHPYIQGNNPEDVVHVLKEKGYTKIVTLEERLSGNIAALAQTNALDHEEILIVDFKEPTLDDVSRLFNLVTDQKSKVVIHCMGGNGRTGTMLAALVVIQEVVSEFKMNPSACIEGANDLTQQVSILSYDGKARRDFSCTALVKRAIDAVRSVQNGENSVETDVQVKFLMTLQTAIISEQQDLVSASAAQKIEPKSMLSRFIGWLVKIVASVINFFSNLFGGSSAGLGTTAAPTGSAAQGKVQNSTPVHGAPMAPAAGLYFAYQSQQSKSADLNNTSPIGDCVPNNPKP